MKLSVIIVTRNRASMFKNCLDSLVCQTKKSDEVVVVDGDSEDNTKEIVFSFNKKLPIKYVNEPKIGFVYAYEAGIRNAKYDIIAFIDDDCIAEEKWIEEIKRLNKKYPLNFIFQGKSLNGYKGNLFAETTKLVGEFCYLKNRKGYLKNIDTRNTSLKKSALRSLKCYFDESFSKVNSCEDIDLSIRLQLKGCKILYAPRMVVTHFYTKDFTSFVKQHFNGGRGCYVINSKWKEHPIFITKSLENPILLIGSALLMPFLYTFDTIKIKGLRGALHFPFFILQKLAFTVGYIYEKQKNRKK